MKIAVFPYAQSYENEYTTIKQKLVREYGELIEYKKLRRRWKLLSEVDVIMIDWLENYFEIEDFAILFAARILNKKVIWTFHNKRPHEFTSKEYIWIYRYLILVCSHIVIHSKGSISCLKKYLPVINRHKICYIPHPNYINIYKKSDLNVRNRYGIKESDFLFLFLGAVRPYKNIEILIDAFAGLKDGNIKLLIAGAPYNEDYIFKIKKLAGTDCNIIFDLKYVLNTEIYAYMEAADIVVLPYNINSSMNSGTLVLAFSCGKPAIVSEIEMVKDIKKYNVVYAYDYATDKEHVKNLRKCMEQAINDGRIKVKEKGNNALKVAEGYYSVKRMQQKYDKMFCR